MSCLTQKLQFSLYFQSLCRSLLRIIRTALLILRYYSLNKYFYIPMMVFLLLKKIIPICFYHLNNNFVMNIKFILCNLTCNIQYLNDIQIV